MGEWKKIWEVTIWDKRFQGVDKSMQAKIKQYPYLLAKDLFALARPYGDIKLLSTGVQEGWTTKEVAGKYLCEGEIVSIPWGKSPGAKNPVKYYKGKFVTGDNRIATSSDLNVLNNKYLYYWLVKNNDLLETFYRGAGIQHPSMYMVLTMDIPLLPISEQTRIVGILDTFTSAIDNLKEQIAQRRKQYEYYRDQLLDLVGKPGVEMKTLPEISDNRDRVRKPITSSKRKAGNYPYYGASGIVDYVDGYIFDGDYLLISEDGANLVARSTPIAFSITGKNWVNNHAHVLQFKDKATQKYVEIYLNMIDLEPWINGAAQPKLNQDNLNKISIPLPPLSEQQRIVSILDTFEASIQNLEAQLKEREKQYEYYRNKLLTFDKI